MESREVFNIQQEGQPKILDPVMVKYYDVDTPLKQLAVVSIPEARQLMIKPFWQDFTFKCSKAIFEVDLGLTPTNDGRSELEFKPALTSDRRQFVNKLKKWLKKLEFLLEIVEKIYCIH